MSNIIGFSNYCLDKQNKLYSLKGGGLRLLQGAVRNRSFRITADNGEVVLTSVPKIRWCIDHGISPADFPKGDFIVSEKFGVVDRSQLMQRVNDEILHKPWTVEEATAELDRIMHDSLLQRQYYRDGNMAPLIARFMEFADEAKDRLRFTYRVSELDIELIMSRELDKFCQMLKRNYPIHSIKALVVSGSYSRFKELQREKKRLREEPPGI